MACTLPWVKDQHIPNIFQHCPGKWVGGGGWGSNKKCGQQIYIKNTIYIYQDQMF